MGAVGKAFVQKLGNGQTQYTVANELKSLVVATLTFDPAHARVRQRNFQQLLVLEPVAQSLLEVLEFARPQHEVQLFTHIPSRPPDGRHPAPKDTLRAS